MDCPLFRNAEGLLECRICKRPWKCAAEPTNVHRQCRGVLNWTGRLLVRMQPGDGIALAAQLTGAAALAKAWEEITGQPCGCSDRQAWLNYQWEGFVWHRFASMPPPIDRPPRGV